jgi:hypothetical protein
MLGHDLRTHSEDCTERQALIVLAAVRIRHSWRRSLRSRFRRHSHVVGFCPSANFVNWVGGYWCCSSFLKSCQLELDPDLWCRTAERKILMKSDSGRIWTMDASGPRPVGIPGSKPAPRRTRLFRSYRSECPYFL